MLNDKEKRKRFFQRIRVPVGFASVILLIVFARPTIWTLAMGSIVALFGLLIRAWAAGNIRKFEQLAVTGPYSFTRNPLYFGSFLLTAGLSVAAGVWWVAIVIGVLYLSIYFPVMRVEESDLRTRFGSEFEEYAKNVPLFVPRFTPWKKMDTGFDFQLYLKNREYEATLGAAVVLIFLSAKMYFFTVQ